MEELANLILMLCPWALPGPQNGYVMEEIKPFWDIWNSRNTKKRVLYCIIFVGKTQMAFS